MAEFDVCVIIDAQIENALDFPVQHFFGKAVFGDTVAQHAP